MDQDHLNWIIKNINKRKCTPYMMANEKLADDMFPYLKMKYPEAIMIKIGLEQWITVNKKSQNALIRNLKNRKIENEKVIKEIDNAIVKIEN